MAKKSTIVPKMTMGALLLALATLERVSPRASSSLAERMWFHAGKPPARAARNRHNIPAGHAFTIAVGSSTVTGQRWGDTTAPMVYLVHGWGGWWQQLGAFVSPLTELGYQVVAFDALAHGDSGRGEYGRRSTLVPELARSYEVVVAKFGAPSATIAHSMGCVSVSWAERHSGVAAGSHVFIAPAVSTSSMLETFVRKLRIGDRTRGQLVARVEHRIGRRLEDFDLIPLVKTQAQAQAQDHPRRGPALIVHDRADTMTSALESEALAALWPGSELLVTEALGHYKVLRAESALAAVADFLGPVFSSTRRATA